ncbi:MAG TPA: sigma-70 family RNA polymerase sigma factor [Polyangiales bacterium]
MSDDLQLLEKWRAGDSAAGQELFRRHTATLYRFFQNKAAGGVEDLVQQTMLACLQSQTQYEQRASFRSYLLGVARYQLFDYYRRNKSDAEHLEFNTVTVHDLALSPSSQMAKASEDRMLLEALRRLPINFQIALELSYWEDLSGPELAEILEVPVDTAYSRLRRAKQLLKEQLAALAASNEQLAATQTDLAHWASKLRNGERPSRDDA